jgi:hypothetical protein
MIPFVRLSSTVLEKGNDLYTLRQDVVIEFFDFGADAGNGGVGIVTLLQEHDAFDHIGVVNDLAVFSMDRTANLPQPDFGALCDRRNVANAEGRAVLRFQNSVFNVRDIRKEADFTNIDLLLPGLDEAASGVGVVVGELLLNVADGQAVRDKFLWINADLVFTRDAAETRNIDDAGNLLKLLFELPIFNRLQLHVVVGRIGALEGVPVDLAHRTPVGADLRLQASGKCDLGKAFQYLLAVPLIG